MNRQRMVFCRESIKPACLKGDGIAVYRIVLPICERFFVAVNSADGVAVEVDTRGDVRCACFCKGDGLRILRRVSIEDNSVRAHITHIAHVIGNFCVDDVFAFERYIKGFFIGNPPPVRRFLQCLGRLINCFRYEIFRFFNTGIMVGRRYCHRLNVLKEQTEGDAIEEGVPPVLANLDLRRRRCFVQRHALDRHGLGLGDVFYGIHAVCIRRKG